MAEFSEQKLSLCLYGEGCMKLAEGSVPKLGDGLCISVLCRILQVMICFVVSKSNTL